MTTANLRAWHRLQTAWPWPATRPEVPADLQGFFDAENVRCLTTALMIAPVHAVVLELGTWKGTSAHWMLSSFPEARVVCVDLWRPDQTYPEAGKWGWLAREPHVYDTCQRNLWAFKDRCLLLRARTVDGLKRVAASGLEPDVVYIDAGHTYADVTADLSATLQDFPAALVLGDDYTFPDIRRAVHDVAPAFSQLVVDEHTMWRLVPTKTKWGNYDLEYGRLAVEGRIVLDLGAERGTTAQYFLAKGASRVYVSERDPAYRGRLARWASIEPRVRTLPPLDTPADYRDWMERIQPAAVKVDIEGAEALLLECPDEAIAMPREYAIETHSPALHAAIVARLDHCGYQVTITRRFEVNPNVIVLYAIRGIHAAA